MAQRGARPARARCRERALAALREVGLGHRTDAWPLTLSGGEAQRAGLARALVRAPDLLLLDEPFAALDALTRLRMQDLVHELWRAHRPAVLLVTHDVDEAVLLADRALVLENGRIRAELAIDLPRPRRHAQPGFAALRDALLAALGVEQGEADRTGTSLCRRVIRTVPRGARCCSAARAPCSAIPSPGSRPTRCRAGSRRHALTVGDQNQVTQTLLIASGEQPKLASRVSYANFLGGPAILEAFHGGALDLANVGSAPPAQAQAAGEHLLVVAGARFSEPDYKLAFRPGLPIARLEDLRGKRITYGKGTGRQPFLLAALKAAGLKRKDVTLVSMQVADFPSVIRSGGADVAVLNEPHYSRYMVEYAGKGVSPLPASEVARLPRGLGYLYASAQALAEPAKAAAIRDFVLRWMAA